MIVRHQRHRPPSLPRDILQHHRPGLRDRQRRSRHHTVHLIQFHRSQSLINNKLNFTRQPLRRQSRRNHHAPYLPLPQHSRRCSRNFGAPRPNHPRVIIQQTILHQLQHRFTRPCRLPPISPLNSAPPSPRRLCTRNPTLRLANPSQHFSPRRICNDISCHCASSSPTSRETSPSASPANP